MPRKHNTRHNRGRSRYPQRLAARGLSRTPEMTPYNPTILAECRAREDKLGMNPLEYMLGRERRTVA